MVFKSSSDGHDPAHQCEKSRELKGMTEFCGFFDSEHLENWLLQPQGRKILYKLHPLSRNWLYLPLPYQDTLAEGYGLR